MTGINIKRLKKNITDAGKTQVNCPLLLSARGLICGVK
jgi:hypothetical protein